MADERRGRHRGGAGQRRGGRTTCSATTRPTTSATSTATTTSRTISSATSRATTSCRIITWSTGSAPTRPNSEACSRTAPTTRDRGRRKACSQRDRRRGGGRRCDRGRCSEWACVSGAVGALSGRSRDAVCGSPHSCETADMVAGRGGCCGARSRDRDRGSFRPHSSDRVMS